MTVTPEPKGDTGKTLASPLDSRLRELGLATWVVGLLGSSTLTGFLTALFKGPSRAGAEDAVTFVVAALGGLALTVGFALGYAALRRGRTTGHAAGVVMALCMGTGILVSNLLGVSGVGLDVVAEQVSAGPDSPIGIAISLVAACFFVYGFIASLQAIVCGFLLGHWLDLLRE